MSIAIESIKNLVATTADNVCTKAAELKKSVSSRLDHYIPREKEVEKKTWTEREIQEIHWNTMTLDGPVGIKEWEAYNNSMSNNNVNSMPDDSVNSMSNNNVNSMPDDSVISKVMNAWNKYTGLTYLSQKLEKLSETHNIRLYKHTSELLFKNSDNVVKKIAQVLSSVFGITHLSLVTTLLINQLFPGVKKEPEPQPLDFLRMHGDNV